MATELTQETIETIKALARGGVKLEHWWFHYGNDIADAAKQYFNEHGQHDTGDRRANDEPSRRI